MKFWGHRDLPLFRFFGGRSPTTCEFNKNDERHGVLFLTYSIAKQITRLDPLISFINDEKVQEPEKLLIDQIISSIKSRFVEKEAYRCFSLIWNGRIGTLETSTERLRVIFKDNNR